MNMVLPIAFQWPGAMEWAVIAVMLMFMGAGIVFFVLLCRWLWRAGSLKK